MAETQDLDAWAEAAIHELDPGHWLCLREGHPYARTNGILLVGRRGILTEHGAAVLGVRDRVLARMTETSCRLLLLIYADESGTFPLRPMDAADTRALQDLENSKIVTVGVRYVHLRPLGHQLVRCIKESRK